MFDLPHELPTGWKIKTVEELVMEGVIEKPLDGNHGGTHPKSTDYVENGVPFVMASDLVSGRVNFNSCKFITEKQALALRKGFSRFGDVLISHKATIGRTAIVQKNKHDLIMLTPQVTYYRVKDKERLSNIYLKAFFDSSFFQSILGLWAGAGSTRAYLGITAQLKLPIIIPPLNIQLSIANHASAINNKIELNRQTNQTLEHIAQAMFKSWFVDFDPVRAKIAANVAGENEQRAAMAAISGKEQAELDLLQQQHPGQYQQLQATADLFPDNLIESELGEIPEGWEVKSICELGKVLTGKTPPKIVENAYSELGTPFITPTDINDNVFVTRTGRFLSCDGEKAVKNTKIPAGSICVTCIGSQMGKTIVTPSNSFTNQQINSILVKEAFFRNYLLLNLRRRREEIFLIGSSGSTMPIINKSTFEKIKLLVPEKALLNNFDSFVSPKLNKILHLDLENRKLCEVRDLLLPKLLSGEIDVSKMDLDI